METKKSNAGRWILFIFGLIFFLAGVGAAYSSFGSMTIKYFSSTNWTQVPANISSIELKRHYGESTTYNIKATYSYSYKGNHQSNTITLNDSSDNIGDYWQTLYRKLKQDQANGRAQAWVNPDNPNEALLDRTFRWASVAFGGVFLFMFGGFGFGAMWLSFKATKPVEQETQEARINGISSKEKTGFWVLFIFGCPFLLIGLLTFFLALPDIINKGEYGALFTLIFVFAGGGIMLFAYINQRRYKTIGPTPLFLDPLPGAIGGQVAGQFDILFWSQNTPIKITLSCKRRVKHGKNTSTQIVWQETMQGYIKQSSKGMNVSFLFDCPENLPSSSSDSIFWEVRAESNLRKQSQPITFERNWDIPVEVSKATASSIRIPERFLQQQSEDKAQLVQDDAADLIKFNQQGSFLDIENTSKRPISNAFGGILFGLIFTGSGVFTIAQDWWPGYIFVFIGSLITYISIFMLGRSVDVKIDTAARILYTKRKWFGITLYKREVMLFAPSQFSIKQTSSTTSEKELTQWYKVEVDNSGKKVLIAEGIKGKELAEALKNNIIEKAFPQRFKTK